MTPTLLVIVLRHIQLSSRQYIEKTIKFRTTQASRNKIMSLFKLLCHKYKSCTKTYFYFWETEYFYLLYRNNYLDDNFKLNDGPLTLKYLFVNVGLLSVI